MGLYGRYLRVVLVAWLSVTVFGWAWEPAYPPLVALIVLFAVVAATLPPLLGTHWLVTGPLRDVHRKRRVDLVAAAAVSVAWTAGVVAAAGGAPIFSPDPPMSPERLAAGVLTFGAATTVIVERSLRLTTRTPDGPAMGNPS